MRGHDDRGSARGRRRVGLQHLERAVEEKPRTSSRFVATSAWPSTSAGGWRSPGRTDRAPGDVTCVPEAQATEAADQLGDVFVLGREQRGAHRGDRTAPPCPDDGEPQRIAERRRHRPARGPSSRGPHLAGASSTACCPPEATRPLLGDARRQAGARRRSRRCLRGGSEPRVARARGRRRQRDPGARSPSAPGLLRW